VTERYTRDSFDTIRCEVTMEDPVVFTRQPGYVECVILLGPRITSSQQSPINALATVCVTSRIGGAP